MALATQINKAVMILVPNYYAEQGTHTGTQCVSVCVCVGGGGVRFMLICLLLFYHISLC